MLQPGDHILFYGDSITDAGRSRENCTNEGLGGGYVSLIAARLLCDWPGELTITNKGIGGNRIGDLEGRLQEDVLALEPDVVSILIGINDTWRSFDSGVKSEIPDFVRGYRNVLDQLRAKGIRLVICEPFVLPVPADRLEWRVDLDPRINAIRELAREYDAVYVPFDGLFAAAACRADAAFWARDGVHPSLAGHQFMADAWLEAVDA